MCAVTGADLRKRIVRIMSGQRIHRLSYCRKLLLLAIGSTAVGAPVLLGLVNRTPRILAQLLQPDSSTTQPFEVASVKRSLPGDDVEQLFMSRGRFTTKGETIKAVIEFAYNIKSDNQLSGGPRWINSEKYDIAAKEEDSVVENLQKLPSEERVRQIRSMVRALLADRFKLKVSHQTKELPVYALVVVKIQSRSR
jgi:bla regulator protein blaR1